MTNTDPTDTARFTAEQRETLAEIAAQGFDVSGAFLTMDDYVRVNCEVLGVAESVYIAPDGESVNDTPSWA